MLGAWRSENPAAVLFGRSHPCCQYKDDTQVATFVIAEERLQSGRLIIDSQFGTLAQLVVTRLMQRGGLALVGLATSGPAQTLINQFLLKTPMRILLSCFLTLVVVLLSAPPSVSAPTTGRVTGLPIPRFVSLGSNRANMRVGPGTDYPIKWVYRERGLPLEVMAEYDNWRKVRDQAGVTGWMYHALLSGRRTGTVAPWKHSLMPLYSRAKFKAEIVAKLQTGLVVHLLDCNGHWCRVSVKGGHWHGYVPQSEIWGIYPGEVLQ